MTPSQSSSWRICSYIGCSLSRTMPIISSGLECIASFYARMVCMQLHNACKISMFSKLSSFSQCSKVSIMLRIYLLSCMYEHIASLDFDVRAIDRMAFSISKMRAALGLGEGRCPDWIIWSTFVGPWLAGGNSIASRVSFTRRTRQVNNGAFQWFAALRTSSMQVLLHLHNELPHLRATLCVLEAQSEVRAIRFSPDDERFLLLLIYILAADQAI